MKFPNTHFLAPGILKPLDDTDEFRHMLCLDKYGYQITCKPSKNEWLRRRRVNFLSNTNKWEEVTCPQCLAREQNPALAVLAGVMGKDIVKACKRKRVEVKKG